MNQSGYSQMTKAEIDANKILSNKMAEVNTFKGEPPEPEMLLALLKKNKTRFWKNSIKIIYKIWRNLNYIFDFEA